ncbi:hypothetical protein PSQ19_14635 [Devosia algicola]|uniref:SnoaL-like domain-containing protein n=1 Tax=Devosia algicola TaxID=3026418 RepID=A0ABY7YKZ6_9HYPH|nr:hypothetical protein [Devosia algicola]WDR01923.1 hypothetical protein PSQ19_14635 [Devosia algicola]
MMTAFWQASRTGDMQALRDLFAEDIELHTDGGGEVVAAINILRGKRRAIGLFVGLARRSKYLLPPCPELCTINGAPGFVSLEPGGVLQTTAIDIAEGVIRAIWIVRNPKKLRHLKTPPSVGTFGTYAKTEVINYEPCSDQHRSDVGQQERKSGPKYYNQNQ